MSIGSKMGTCLVRLLLAFVVLANPMLARTQVRSSASSLEDQKPAAQDKNPAREKEPEFDKNPPPKKEPEFDRNPAPKIPEERPRFSSLERKIGTASLPVTRGVRLRVDNRTSGRITVHGWDQDVIEAHAFSARGEEVLIVAQSDEGGPKSVFLKSDYTNLDNPAAATEILDLPPVDANGPIQVHIEVNVPRYVEIELLKVYRSNVEFTGVETPLTVIGQNGDITLKDVGSVEAHTRSGAISIENSRGIADVTSSTGPIKVVNSRGAVRVVSITGTIEVRCVKGRVDVGNTQAAIELAGIDGDVEAIAAGSDIRLTGPLSGDGRYYLKSMTGRVEMIVPADTRGFNATLTSYKGTVASDFQLRPKVAPATSDTTVHRLAGRYGNGSPQITLDSFEGPVKLTKMSANGVASCP